MQNAHVRSRAGWAAEETRLMWDEVRRASEGGGTLKTAFVAVAEKTGRKPDSIRNFYYQSLKAEDAPEELQKMRAQPFTPFSHEEIEWMLREILKARGEGESVRACVQRLGNGDRALALRYQNKYRSILKNRSELIGETLAALREEGFECPNPYESLRVRRMPEPGSYGQGGIEAEQLLQAMRDMLARQEREETMRHREEIDRMSVRCDLLRLELARRDEMLLNRHERDERVTIALRKASGMMEACDELLAEKDIKAARERLKKMIEELQTFDESGEGINSLDALLVSDQT